MCRYDAYCLSNVYSCPLLPVVGKSLESTQTVGGADDLASTYGADSTCAVSPASTSTAACDTAQETADASLADASRYSSGPPQFEWEQGRLLRSFDGGAEEATFITV